MRAGSWSSARSPVTAPAPSLAGVREPRAGTRTGTVQVAGAGVKLGSAGENGMWPVVSPSARPLLRTGVG